MQSSVSSTKCSFSIWLNHLSPDNRLDLQSSVGNEDHKHHTYKHIVINGAHLYISFSFQNNILLYTFHDLEFEYLSSALRPRPKLNVICMRR